MIRSAVLPGILFAAIVAGGSPAQPGSPAPDPEAVAAERAANEVFLAREETRRRLADIADGSWVAVWGGGALETSPFLDVLLAAIDSRSRTAAHRFVFRKGTEGDVEEKTTFSYEQIVGMGFLDLCGMSISSYSRTSQGMWTATIGSRNADFPLERTLDGDGTGRMLLRATISGAGEGLPLTLEFGVGTAYSGIMVLPAGVEFHRSEIPGRVRAEGIYDYRPAYRRYLVRLRVKGLDIDRSLEVAGGRVEPPPRAEPLVLWGRTCPRLDAAARIEARRQGRPILLYFPAREPAIPPRAELGSEEVKAALRNWFLVAPHGPGEPLISGERLEIENDKEGNRGGAFVIALYPTSAGSELAFPSLRTGHGFRLDSDVGSEDLAAFLRRERERLRPK